jgi:hypothetical protein
VNNGTVNLVTEIADIAFDPDLTRACWPEHPSRADPVGPERNGYHPFGHARSYRCAGRYPGSGSMPVTLAAEPARLETGSMTLPLEQSNH